LAGLSPCFFSPAQHAEAPERKLVRQTYHVEQRFTDLIKREAYMERRGRPLVYLWGWTASSTPDIARRDALCCLDTDDRVDSLLT
jgi:hypothetical protein